MIQEFTLRLSPEQAANEHLIARHVAVLAGVHVSTINASKVVKRSIDARGREVIVQLKVKAAWGDHASLDTHIAPFAAYNVANAPEVVVVGSGPAGLFAALTLIERGLKPIVVERGKDVSRRKRDIAQLNQTGLLDHESNYCFGEGGAGTFSDGKIYTRSNKRGDISRVLELFVIHGAHPDILIESHPHIGTDKLPAIIERIRQTIVGHGGEVHFDSLLTDLVMNGNRVSGVKINNDVTIKARAVIIATGHSARDVFQVMARHHVPMQAKPFAMGVRVEHPRELIDTIQYHGMVSPYLPTASYSLLTQVNNRGVYSFCMCPGGIIVPASTGANELVVNGMSNSNRNSAFSNSGIAVEITADDFYPYSEHGAMAALALQRLVEQRAWEQSPGAMKAPAQRLTDFVRGKPSQNLPRSSYIPGLSPSPLHEWLPAGIGKRLQRGFDDFGKKMRGFLTSEAVVVGVESRTSSPVRVPRDPLTFCINGVENLYACGEGAGYAGGITSSALDGIACASKIPL